MLKLLHGRFPQNSLWSISKKSLNNLKLFRPLSGPSQTPQSDDMWKEEIYGRERIYNDDSNVKWRWISDGRRYNPFSGFINSHLTSMFLPINYPSSVHRCYLKFHMWQASETYIGAIVSVLCSQAMLESLGIANHAATAGAVAIQWVLKDGIAEIGKLLFIKQYARSFDSHPKSWKAVGEVLTTLGSGLQLCTLLFPSTYFLTLAAGGNILKSTSWALWGATHMWFTRNFALVNNIGDLTAKSEGQGAFALITGWLTGISLISYSHTSTFLFASYFTLVPLHAFATYMLLKNAEFETVNQAKAEWIIQYYVRHNKVLGTKDKLEGVGLFGEFRNMNKSDINVQLGCSIEDAFTSLHEAKTAVDGIRDENYIIGIKGKNKLGIVLHKDADTLDVLKSICHAVKLGDLLEKHPVQDTDLQDPIVFDLYEKSHSWTQSEFPALVSKMEALDWQTDSLTFDDPGYRASWKKLPRLDKVQVDEIIQNPNKG